MRLAISNIAWDAEEDAGVAQLLNRYEIDAVDVAPTKYFADPAAATDGAIGAVRAWWADRGIEITGMQSLLFGTSGLNVFGPPAVQDAMLEHLTAICRIGAGLGAVRLVFGSPRNRDRSGLSDPQAVAAAVSFFRRLGDIAAAHGVIVCLEPNPPCYGANFMMTSPETAKVVEQIAHSAIRMQLDTGSLAINGETAHAILNPYARLVGHVHASERDLLPLGDGESDHAEACAALRQYMPDALVTVEMAATKDEPHLQSVERAIQCAVRYYRQHENKAST